MSGAARFWNRFADRYAARPIKDVAAYEALLKDVAARLKPDNRVLEIGCGTGGTAIRLAEEVAQYVATDFSAEMIRISKAKPAPPNLRFLLAAADALPEGGPFNAICAFNVLHLVDDLPGLLHRLRRGLALDGLLICKTWCFGDLPLRFRVLFRALRLVGLFPPARFLTQADLHQTLQAAGFAVEATRVFGARTQNPYIVARATETPRDVVSLPKSEGLLQ
jgi:cyclopropane fatty-acyl-phospholipid synthase-like methyltransferase